MTTKRFLRFQILLLVLLIISVIGTTFSWANRPAVKGGGFMSGSDSYYAGIELVTSDYYVNGTQCTAVTYKGTRDEETGVITYEDEPEGANPVPVTSFTDDNLTKGEVHYFKTIITNPTQTTTHVSLFLSGYTSNTLTASVLGVSTPITNRAGFTESYFDTTTNTRYFKLEPVISEYEMAPAKNGTSATAKVEWYVFYDDGSADNHNGKFHISDIILSNN